MFLADLIANSNEIISGVRITFAFSSKWKKKFPIEKSYDARNLMFFMAMEALIFVHVLFHQYCQPPQIAS